MSKQLLLIVLAAFFTQLAWAQQIYKWKDEKGQWHYSDFFPSGVTAEKVERGDNTQGPALQPSAPTPGEKKEAIQSSNHSNQVVSDIDPMGSAPKYLLVFPPVDPSKPLSEWIPVQSFDSAGECFRALPIGVSTSESIDFPRMTWTSVNFGARYSRCISLAQFKPRKEGNVIMAVTSVGPDPGGFSTWHLYVKVFNGGQTTARNVVVTYRLRGAGGIIYATGKIVPTPQDLPPLTFGEYWEPIVRAAGGSDRWVETEAEWSKD